MNIGPDSIEFDIPGPGPHVISVNSELPPITDSLLVIDGTTQPGNFPMAGLIIIDGSALAPGGNHGLVIYKRRTEIYGLQIQNFPDDGIQFFAGTFGEDLYLANIIIGAPGKGNVIISNGAYGVDGPVTHGLSIQGNYVGTDLAFNQGLGNGFDGIFLELDSSFNVTIGGSRDLNEQNYLCSNGYSGLRVHRYEMLPAAPYSITGNIVGTDDSGVRNLGNGSSTIHGGINLIGNAPVTLGGAGGLANIIAFNSVGIVTLAYDGKTILENHFYCNFKGIGLLANANNGILPPAILCTQGNSLIGIAPPGMMIDVYRHDATLCPDALCQGRTLLGQVTAGVDGQWSFDVSAWPGAEFTAIAQDAMGNSSEFSSCVLDPNVIAYNTGPFCPEDTIFLFSMLDTAVGNVTFEWFGPSGYTSTVQNPVDATESGTYTVVANIMGCGADTATTDVMVYPIASDTIRELCIEDSLVVNGNVYNSNNPFGIEVLDDAAQNGCDSVVVIVLNFDFSLTANIFSTRPRACLGDSVSYWFSILLNGVGGGGPLDVIYSTGIGPPDTLYGNYDGHSQKIGITSDVHFEILDVITDLTICEPRINISDSIMVSALNITPLVTDYDGFGVSCFGENDGMISLNVTGAVGTVDYDWNLAALNGDIAMQLTAGNYSVTVMDEAGCSVTFDTLITQPAMFESITRTEETTCAGISDGVIFIEAILGARGPVEYSINGGPFTPVTSLPLQIPNLAPGVVNLVLMDSSGCTDNLSVFVPLGATPGIDLGTERSILSGDSVLLSFNTTLLPEQIIWSPSAILSCPTCPVTYAFPQESQFISVTLSDSSGCVASDSVLILVFVPKQIYIPNVFSPNGDNINDIFYLQANEFAEEVEYLIIADRWGDVVFEKTLFPINDPAYGWDGTLDGKTMFPAVFTYLARIRFSDGEVIPHSGTVTLLR